VINLKPPLAALAIALSSQAALAATGPSLDVSGDVRIRGEQDWDSQNAAGVKRLERTRFRIRARLNVKANLGGGFVARGRVRTGGEGSQQNANITFHDFDGNPEDTLKLSVDQFSLAWQGKSGGVEVGRMAFPFFTQNEYFWDGDINPLGFAGNISVPIGKNWKLRLNGGAFKLPVALSLYAGELIAGQGVLEHKSATLAAGLFRFNADRSDPDRLRLLHGNGSRDYGILALNARYKLPLGGRSFVLGADFYQNLKSYRNSSNAINRANASQRTGYVLSAAWGDTSKPGHFQLGYRWSHMEKLAVNASYAHDDLARFGTPAQAALTDLKGHDIYANVAVTKSITIGVRTMLVKRITNIENGKRARIDLSYKFN
jgi:hypothetical protein